MKFHREVSSSRRKQRKAHFTAPSHERRIRMSAPLSSELAEKYGVHAVPIRVGDEVRITRGKYKMQEGKVKRCHRKKYRIAVEGVAREDSRGLPVDIGIHPSKVQIIALRLDKDRTALLKRKERASLMNARTAPARVAVMADVD
jgi:large subunit ribosomal protein L26e